LSRRVFRAGAVCAALTAALAVGVASASASTLYVSNSAPAVKGGKSCTAPAYNSVQTAIEAGSSIDVCPGTYTEQLTITKAVKLVAVAGTGTATVQLPPSAPDSTSTCDTEVKEGQIDEVSICTSGTVTINDLNVEALIPLATCTKGLNGIFVGGGGTLKANNLTVNGASTTLNEDKGCQHGISIAVGLKTPNEVGHAVLKKVTSIGYEKNGPTVRGVGSTLAMSSSTVTGEGASPYTAQNGVEIAYGAEGVVKSSTISGNECDLAEVCGATGEQASGVLFYQAAAGSSVSSSTITENDMGIYYASGSSSVPPSPDVTMTKDILTSNRYEGVYLEEGKTALKNLTIKGSGRVGIELFQSAGEESAIESSASSTKISGQSEASIKVSSDKQPTDKPGKFLFSKGTAAAPVLINESNRFEVIF
jgi:nitrous oxidase accessory protein NosD